MRVGIPKESRPGENRVAITPEVVKLLAKSEIHCFVESNAGLAASFTDASYTDAGAIVLPDAKSVFDSSDVVIKVNPPSLEEASGLKQGSVLISFMYAYTIPEIVKVLQERKINSFSMDAVPRISRAQSMDALSSQANLAGYKAVLLGGNASGKIFPMMMTAGGTIKPSKVLIFGAGVAGLQAIATAKRLGAIVEVTDVRPETKEQVESLGGRFLEVKSDAAVQTEGGYAKEVSKEYLEAQQELIKKHIQDADVVITTALVIGKKAPVLVTTEMVKTMKPGSVIVDMAVESGGNCELSVKGETIKKEGVVIIGETNLPSLLAVNASELYSRNIATLLLHLADKNGFHYEMEEEITKGSLITYNGELVHEFTKQILNK